MSKSSFNALVEAKKQRDTTESDAAQTERPVENKPLSKKVVDSEENSDPKAVESAGTDEQTAKARPRRSETVRRSYRVDEAHDKAVKVMSKFMGQGTEEEIVLNIFSYFFENNADGKKAIQMVELLETK